MSHDLCCYDENDHHGNDRHKDGHGAVGDADPVPGASHWTKQTQESAAEEEGEQDGDDSVQNEYLSETGEEEDLGGQEGEDGEEGCDG